MLAQQHFGTFTERLRDYPFRIEMVSRFRSAEETRAGAEGLRGGQGRHPRSAPIGCSRATCARGPRACSIVDEEQRFGVKQKELLRQLRLRVDVLSLTRDPDPRTLQMSLAGPARHLGDRDPARGPPPGEDLRGRVRRGAGAPGDRARGSARGGQAFFLHNRVDTIEETAERVQAMCPQRAGARGPRPDGREAPRAGDAQLPRAARRTCSCAPRSWSRASTSRAPTR
ncbi:MAG: hypothetical protein WKF40_05255 [Thermoleophilaceae bacterium]